MSKFQIKKLPPIKLTDLLKKRKTNLRSYLSSSGITTYVTLQQKCDNLGVLTPTEAEFQEAVDVVVSSPQEGVVVLDPPSLLKDTGEKVQVDELKLTIEESNFTSKKVEVNELQLVDQSVEQQKISKKKKEKEKSEEA